MDRNVVEFIGRYRQVTRPHIERTILGGKCSGNVVRRLRASGHLRTRAYSGRRSFYQLTAKSLKALVLPESRSEAPGSQALWGNLKAASYCLLAERRRHRLERAELEELLGMQAGEGPFAIEAEPTPRVLRLYAVGPHTAPSSVASAVDTMKSTWAADEVLASWMDTRQLGIAVLVDSESQRTATNRLLRSQKEDLHLVVEAVAVPGLSQ